MTTKIEYTCDCCGAAADKSDDMWEVLLQYRTKHNYRYQPSLQEHTKRDWCRGCMEKNGFLGSKLIAALDTEAAKANPPPAPTFEELVRDFIVEEVRSAMEP